MVDLEVHLNKFFLDYFKNSYKEIELISFLSNLPKGEAFTNTINFLNSLNHYEILEFKNILYSKSSVEEITKEDYESVIGSKLFQLEPKGIGKAEIFLACVIKDSVISGGGQSFDLKIGYKYYEVKDYRKAASKPIRLGTKGKVTRFPFWQEIIKTIKYLEKHKEYLDTTSAKSAANRILAASEFILGGELNKSMISTFHDLYTSLYKETLTDNTDISTHVIKFYSSSTSPVIYTSRYVSFDDQRKTITIQIEEFDFVELAKIDLRRISFVRQPNSFIFALQDAVDKCVDPKIPFVVFRPDGPIITTSFRFHSVSQGGIYIHENY